MSLLMLATGGGSPLPVDLRPAPLDATIAAMRPSGRLLDTLTVAPDGSEDYTTISAAVAAANSLQAAQLTADGVTVRTPNHRVDIIVHAGSYVESIVLPAWVALYGVGSGLVTVTQDNTNPQLGTVTPSGSTYIEGIKFVKNWQNADTVPLPKYPIHNVNNHTSVFADVVFDNQLGGTAYGADGADYGYTVLYKCGLIGGTNAHGWDYTLAGQQIAYVNCTANSSVNWAALNNTAPDECWVVGGSVGSISVTGTATVLHKDPATVVSGSVSAAGAQDSNTAWPVPTGGLSAYDRALYGM